jgi:hypothetical protein
VLLAFLYPVLCGLLRLLLVRGQRLPAAEIELLALRHERRVLRRRTGGAAWRPADRLLLAALSRCLPPDAWHVLPVHPATLRRWQREVAQRRWGPRARRRPGRPPLAADLQALIVRLARENPRWGYVRLKGELLKLGHDVSATAIRTTLRRRGVPPAPQRAGLTWPGFLRAQAAGILASAPVPGRALGTCLLAAWMLRVVLVGRPPPSHWGSTPRIGGAHRTPRSQISSTRHTAPAGAPRSAVRGSRLWVPATVRQRVPAEEERRTDAPPRMGAAWRRPGERRDALSPGRPVAAECRGRAPPAAGRWMRAETGPAASVRGGVSRRHERRGWPAETDRLSAA